MSAFFRSDRLWVGVLGDVQVGVLRGCPLGGFGERLGILGVSLCVQVGV